ncbi:MAG: hypothetical protein WCY80_04130 [Candidatus Izemoplasmatales bacterium]
MNNFITLAIMESINNFLEPIITDVLTKLTAFPIWLQAVILLALGIFVIIGLIVFIKKFVKLFLVLAILGVIVWFVWSRGYLDSILPNAIFTQFNNLI